MRVDYNIVIVTPEKEGPLYGIFEFFFGPASSLSRHKENRQSGASLAVLGRCLKQE